MVEKLVVALGFDGSKFVEGAKDAEKGVNRIAEGLGKLGLMAGALSLFGKAMYEIVEYSGKYRENMSEAQWSAFSAVSQFKRDAEEAKGIFLEAGSSVLGFFTKAGEGYGKMIVNIKELFVKGSVAMMEENEKRERQMAEQEAERERMRKEGYFEQSKRIADIAKQTKDFLTMQEGLQAQINAKGDEAVRLEKQIAEAKDKTGAKRKLEADLAAVMLDITKLVAKQEDENKKKAEERIKNARLSNEEERQLAKLLEKNIDTLTRSEKRELEILRLKKEKKETEAEIDKMLKDGAQALTDAQLDQVAALQKQLDKIDERIAKEQQVLGTLKEQTQETKNQAEEEDKKNKKKFKYEPKPDTFGAQADRVGDVSSLSDYELRVRASQAGSRLDKAVQAGGMNGTSAQALEYMQAKSLADAYQGAIEMRRKAEQTRLASERFEVLKAAGNPSTLIASSEYLFNRWQELQAKRDEFDKQFQSTLQRNNETDKAGNDKLDSINSTLSRIESMWKNEGLSTVKTGAYYGQ